MWYKSIALRGISWRGGSKVILKVVSKLNMMFLDGGRQIRFFSGEKDLIWWREGPQEIDQSKRLIHCVSLKYIITQCETVWSSINQWRTQRNGYHQGWYPAKPWVSKASVANLRFEVLNVLLTRPRTGSGRNQLGLATPVAIALNLELRALNLVSHARFLVLLGRGRVACACVFMTFGLFIRHVAG